MDKVLSIGLMIGIVTFSGALVMGIVTGKTVRSISRRPEEYPKIRGAFIIFLFLLKQLLSMDY